MDKATEARRISEMVNDIGVFVKGGDTPERAAVRIATLLVNFDSPISPAMTQVALEAYKKQMNSHNELPPHIMHLTNLDTIAAVQALVNITGRTETFIRERILRAAQNAADGRFSARTTTGFGYTVINDDAEQCWRIDYETEAND